MFLTKKLIAGVIVAILGITIGTSPISKEFIAEASNPTVGFAFGVSSGTLEFVLDLSAIIPKTKIRVVLE